MPQSYSPELVDQDSLDARSRERKRATDRRGRASTILTANANTGLAGAGLPPTSGTKTALGS